MKHVVNLTIMSDGWAQEGSKGWIMPVRLLEAGFSIKEGDTFRLTLETVDDARPELFQFDSPVMAHLKNHESRLSTIKNWIKITPEDKTNAT